MTKRDTNMTMRRTGRLGGLLALVAAMLTFAIAALVPAVALADNVPAPAHSKDLVDNGDGTYTLSLSVTGSQQSSSQSTGANVIIVMDTSGSMRFYNYEQYGTGRYGSRDGGQTVLNLYSRRGWSYSQITNDSTGGTVYTRDGFQFVEYTGQRYRASSTRMEVAKEATNSLIDQLLANNTTADPDRVEIALITFATDATTRQTWSTSANTLKQQVNGLSADGGTNWHAALQRANNLQNSLGDDDPVYIIFVSDGNPTYYLNEWGVRQGSGSENNQNVANSYNAAVPSANAIRDAGKGFYAIGAFGDVDRMQSLATEGGGAYYAANDAAALNAAFADIVQSITNSIGYEDVQITDGITTMTSLRLVNGATDNFSYSVTNSNGQPVTVANLPEATFENGEVSWDLSSLDRLENGYTYTVSFRVWPSQEAYDLVAALNNGQISYDGLTEAQKAQIVRTAGGVYGLKTNTHSSVSATRVETIQTTTRPDGWTRDGDVIDGFTYTYDSATGTYTGTKKTTTDPTSFTDPEPMGLTDTSMSVHKSWVDQLGYTDRVPVTMQIFCDDEATPYWTGELNEQNQWEAGANIAAGVMTVSGNTVTVLEPGHDYRMQENAGSDYHWEFDAPVVHPMVLNGKLTMLEKVDGPQDGAYQIGDGYYVKSQNAAATWEVSNHRRSHLNITKSVTDKTNGAAPADAAFTYTVTINDPSGSDVWFSVRDAKGATVTSTVTGATAEDGGYFSVASGATFTVQLQAGWNFRAINLPVGSTYTVTEQGDMPDGFDFASASVTPADAVVSAAGQTTEGTIDRANASYELRFTNTYDSVVTGETADSIKVTKAVTGRAAVEQFDFSLAFKEAQRDGAPVTDGYSIATGGDVATTTTNGFIADGQSETVSFGNVTFTKPGTYTFTVDETTTTDKPGWTYDASTHDVTVEVGYNSDGKLVATVNGNNPTFTNSYKAASVEASIQVLKNLDVPAGFTGEDITGKFTFTLAAVDGAPLPAVTSKTNPDADGGTVTFGPIEFTAPGTYTYNVTETGSVQGVTNDAQATKPFTIVVTDDGSGQLRASSTSVVAFSNSYSASSVRVRIPALKVLEIPAGFAGTDITGKFTFSLYEGTFGTEAELAGHAPIQQKTNNMSTGGSIEFDSEQLTFDTPGTYDFTVVETGSVAGVANDAAPFKHVAVTVVDNGDGTLSATIAGADADPANPSMTTFTNSYSASAATVSIPVRKALEVPEGLVGPDDVANKFTFALAAVDGTPMPAVTSKTNPDADGGTVTFGPIEFTAPGTYTYNVTETGSVAGVTNDRDATNGKTVTVSVTDDGEGHLVARASSTDDAPLTFTNSYSATAATASIPVTKALEVPAGLAGPDDITGRYSFTLRAYYGAPTTAPDGSAIELTVTNPDVTGGTARYGEISYKTPGTYSYTITEHGSVDGVTNDATLTKNVFVEVEDNRDGTLSATVRGADSNGTSDVEDTTFTNTYNAANATLAIPVAKVVEVESGNGPTDVANKFTFTLTGENGAPVPANNTVTNPDGDGTAVSFDEITFGAPGTYTYKVTESGEVAGVTNDQDATNGKTVTVTVTDNGAGQLVATADSTANSPLTFTNTYSVDPVQPPDLAAYLSGTKVMEGRELNAGDYSFELAAGDAATDEAVAAGNVVLPNNTTAANAADGSFSFGGITFKEPGTYAFEIYEVLPDGVTSDSRTKDGVTYDTHFYRFTVEIKDNGAGELVLGEDTTGQSLDKTFTNTYAATPATASITVSKSLEVPFGMTGPGNIAGKFTFTLEAVGDAPMPESGTVVTNPDTNGGTATFGEITFTAAGEYNYTITETGAVDGVINDENATKTVTVKVTDDGLGTLTATVVGADRALGLIETNTTTFTNKYSGEAAVVQIPVKKVLEVPEGLAGPADITGEFSFKLEGQNGAPMPASDTVVNPAANGGTVSFGAITFDAPGTYTYTVTESGQVAGVTNDQQATKTVTVTVTDNGAGQLVATSSATSENPVTFTNTYSAQEIEPADLETYLTGSKVFVGRELTAGAFEFALGVGDEATASAVADGAVVLPGDTTVANDANGSFSFGGIKFTKPGEYVFTISEVLPEGVSAASPTKDGITYDTHVSAFTVTIADNREGELVLEDIITVGDGDTTFTNTYGDNLSATAKIEGTKTLTGRTLKDGEFSATLTGAGVDETKPIAADGSFAFELNYTPASFTDQATVQGNVRTQDFVYTVSEVIPDDANKVPGVTYDTNSFDVTVRLTDDGVGNLTAVVVADASDTVALTNAYKVTPTSFTPQGEKFTEAQSDVSSKKFSYTVSNANDEIVATGTSEAYGAIQFTSIPVTAPGVFTYTISEVNGGTRQGGVNMDGSVFYLTLEVSDNGEGEYSVVPTYTNADHEAVDMPRFVNSYSADDVTVNIDATKVLDGRALIDGEFSFTVTDAGTDKIVSTGVNDAQGHVTFGSLLYSYNVEQEPEATAASALPVAEPEVMAEDVVASAPEAEDGTVTEPAEEIAPAEEGTDAEAAAPAEQDESMGEPVAELEPEVEPVVSEQDELSEPARLIVTGGPVTDLGVHTYYIDELLPAGAQNNVFRGVTYDRTRYVMEVTVSDNGDGTMKAEITYLARVDNGVETQIDITGTYGTDNVVFNNSYSVKPITVDDPPVRKVVDGTPATASEFTFVLTADDPSFPMPEGAVDGSKTAVVAGAGDVEFGNITFTEAGTYTYKVTEVAGNVEGYTYDNSAFTITYEVKDNGLGEFEVTRTVTKVSDGTQSDVATFVNKYTQPEVPKEPEQPKKKEKLPKAGEAIVSVAGIVVAAVVAGATATGLRRRSSK